MEIEKLIERLEAWNEQHLSVVCGNGHFACDYLCENEDCIVVRAATALEQLQAENDRLKAQVPRWIPVEERLPGDSDGLVIMTDGEIVHPSYGNAMFGFDGKLGVFAPTKRKPWGFMRVTHWMTLPKPPKEED